jgi:hypothetical protein
MNNEIIMSTNNEMDISFFIGLALSEILNVVFFSHEICKIHVIPSLLLTSLCGDNCRRKMHKQEAVEKIKKGNK